MTFSVVVEPGVRGWSSDRFWPGRTVIDTAAALRRFVAVVIAGAAAPSSVVVMNFEASDAVSNALSK
jgi:hypothetical protein